MGTPALLAGYTDRVRDLVTVHRAPCITCGHDRELLVEWFTEPRPAGWFAPRNQRLVWRARVVGISPHRCRGLHSGATVADRSPVLAWVDGKRTERCQSQACVRGVSEYIARRPRTWAEAREGQPVISYRPAARFAVTARGACYVVRSA